MASGLVLIPIVAIIAAVLFPIFAKAREMARKSSCQTSMKCLANSMRMYQNDWYGTYPSSVAGPYGNHWSEAADETFRKKRGYLPRSPKSPLLGAWPEFIIRYNRSPNEYYCPSDPGAGIQDPNGNVSYVVKKAFHMAWWGKGTVQGPARKEGDFRFPADQILLYERRGWHWGDAGKGDISDGTGVSGVTLNAAFMDGHVIAIRIPPDVPGAPSGLKTHVEPDFYNTVAETGKRVTKPGATDPRVYSDTLE
jgi:prepilin-type processing-associated H-X9-DG protein